MDTLERKHKQSRIFRLDKEIVALSLENPSLSKDREITHLKMKNALKEKHALEDELQALEDV